MMENTLLCICVNMFVMSNLLLKENIDFATKMIARVAALNPILLEAIPLTLEEIFIYELGGEDYAVKNIVL